MEFDMDGKMTAACLAALDMDKGPFQIIIWSFSERDSDFKTAATKAVYPTWCWHPKTLAVRIRG
jgi:hypothetical protein